MKTIQYSVVIPAFNEEPVIAETYKRLKKVMDEIGEPYELIFINDGSSDQTGEILDEIHRNDPNLKAIHFARNFGHEAATTAGLDYASGQGIVIIDADLQDPPELIPNMIDKWKQGFEVVYGKRKQRKGESAFKKTTSAFFYRFLQRMTEINMPADVGDFRLIDRKVADALKNIREKNRYMRGIISWVGFRQTAIEFVREERWAGETKYNVKKLLHLAWDAITAFSYKPLKIATYLGFTLSGISFIYLLIVIFEKVFTQKTVPGWASLMAISLFFNGVVLIMLGLLGEYIGRIYEETKNRPLYVIHKAQGFNEKSSPNE
jgi:glycosyltransferase involved in cell wall biosynthesis